MPQFTLPAGFEILRIGPARVLVESARRERLLDAGLARPAMILQTARALGGGRGGAYEVTLGGEDFIMRAYRRGGLARLFMKDRTWDENRSFREVAALVAGRERGVPTVEPVAAVALSTGFGFQRHYLFTIRVPGAVELPDALSEPWRTREEREHLVDLSATAVRLAFDSGIEPPDLHPRNILIVGSTPPQCRLVDFDGATIQAGPLPPAVRIAVLSRFIRFIERHRLERDAGFSRTMAARFIKIIERDNWRRTWRAVGTRVARGRWLHRIGSLWRPGASPPAQPHWVSAGGPRGPQESPEDPAITFILCMRAPSEARIVALRIVDICETAGIANYDILGAALSPAALNDFRVLSLELRMLRFLGKVFPFEGEALRALLRSARGARVMMVAGRAMDARFLTEALERVGVDTDVVVGDRGGSGVRDDRGVFEKFRDRSIGLVLKLIKRTPVHDPLGTIVVRQDDRLDAAVRATRSRRFARIDLLQRLGEAGARMRDVPVEIVKSPVPRRG